MKAGVINEFNLLVASVFSRLALNSYIIFTFQFDTIKDLLYKDKVLYSDISKFNSISLKNPINTIEIHNKK